MPLPDHRIRTLVESSGPEDNRVVIDPFDAALVQPGSYDVRIGPTYRKYRNPGQRVALRDIPDDLTYEIDGSNGFILRPGDFALASTIEHVQVSNRYSMQLDGKSTGGRLGLLIHLTAGWIDAGFAGTVTLELKNLGDLEIELHPGDPIGQLVIFEMASPVERPYGHPSLRSHYQGQSGPTPPRGAVPTEQENAA